MKRPLFGTGWIAGINDEPEVNFRPSLPLSDSARAVDSFRLVGRYPP